MSIEAPKTRRYDLMVQRLIDAQANEYLSLVKRAIEQGIQYDKMPEYQEIADVRRALSDEQKCLIERFFEKKK